MGVYAVLNNICRHKQLVPAVFAAEDCICVLTERLQFFRDQVGHPCCNLGVFVACDGNGCIPVNKDRRHPRSPSATITITFTSCLSLAGKQCGPWAQAQTHAHTH